MKCSQQKLGPAFQGRQCFVLMLDLEMDKDIDGDVEANNLNPMVANVPSIRPVVSFDSCKDNKSIEGGRKFQSFITKSTFTAFKGIKHIRLLQYICCIASFAACIYFTAIGYINVSMQYFQICFLATLTVALDSDSWKKQRLFFVLSVIVGLGWGMVYQWAGYKYLDFAVYSYILSIACSLVFIGGMLAVAYVSILASETKYVELDLLLYLVSLDVMCFFHADDVFDNNLHLILDIRSIVLLYSCLYEPKQKLDLLTSKSFVLIIILIVFCFILFANMSLITDAIANALYVVIGCILFYDSYKGYNKFLDLINRNSMLHY